MEVVYNLNGGTNDPNNPSEYKIGTAGIKLKDPEKDGYKFIGWYTDAEFENRVLYIDGIRDKLVLYANWEYIEETGAADSSLSEQVDSGKSPENPLNPLIFIIPSIVLIVILLGLIVSAIKNRGDQYIDDLEEQDLEQQDQEQEDLEEQDQEQQLEDLDSTRIIEQSIGQESEDSTYEIKFTP